MSAPVKKKALVVTDTCPICKEVKEILKNNHLEDKVTLINASTVEGRRFADENGITGVPECVILDGDGKKQKICTKEEFIEYITKGL